MDSGVPLSGRRFTKNQIATAIALLFHIVGLTGLLFFNRLFFLQFTPGNLLLMLVLLMWTQTRKNKWFFLFFISCFLVGLGVEIMGVRTGILFGQYNYGTVMGYKVWDTPVILGVNWFIVTYCSGMSINMLRNSGIALPALRGTYGIKGAALQVIAGGAFLATIYDWQMEPVAIKLGYWRWRGDGAVPLYNYLCWFLVSTLLLSVFQMAKFEKLNKFAVNLMLIQFLFFLMLRLSLN
jgi:putative membrane protein